MCGIVGSIGKREAKDILIEGLKRLEYRGYDSAGVAIYDGKKINILRAEGKLSALTQKLKKYPLKGAVGIGHTRWATHGRPSETNAHPHRAGDIVLVHNGIIENHNKLRAILRKKGHHLKSETDTEIVAHLIQQRIYDGLSMEKAFEKVLSEIEGTYALVVLNEQEPDRLYVAKQGSPLVIGCGEEGKENFIASDIPAILAQTRKIIFLEDGDWGVVTQDSVKVRNAGKKTIREMKEVTWNRTMAEKGGFKHFMLKEIFEQPKAIADTLAGRLIENHKKISLNGAEKLLKRKFERIYIVACGTSYHAGLVGKYLLEEMARISVSVDHASEFRYRNPLVDTDTLILAISQSGETADTLAALVDAKKKGASILSICNVMESSIPRISHETIYTRAGPEIGVASTKAFTAQLVVLILVALFMGRKTEYLSTVKFEDALEELGHIPQLIEKIFKRQSEIKKIAEKYVAASSALYISRNIQSPIALEGALKLKEISYIHAEAYPAGELKHGPIALIDSKMPVVAIAMKDRTYEKVLSNIAEVKARGARVIGVGEVGDEIFRAICEDFIAVPKTLWFLSPLLSIIPLQLLAYYIADHKGTDVDQPRNLAKSVTVE